MEPSQSLHPARQQGFTLIELAVVVAVMAILAGALIPDMIEAARTRMAEKAAEDVSHIHSAAQWYFTESASSGTPDHARWPGESDYSGGACTDTVTTTTAPGSFQTCCEATTTLAKKPKGQLTGDGYLTDAAFTNPWGHPYLVNLVATLAKPTPACGLKVSTAVPTSVAEAFRSFLPNAPACTADSDCVASNTGMSCCTSTIPKPGGEAPFKYLTDTWIPAWATANVFSDKDSTASPQVNDCTNCIYSKAIAPNYLCCPAQRDVIVNSWVAGTAVKTYTTGAGEIGFCKGAKAGLETMCGGALPAVCPVGTTFTVGTPPASYAECAAASPVGQ